MSHEVHIQRSVSARSGPGPSLPSQAGRVTDSRGLGLAWPGAAPSSDSVRVSWAQFSNVVKTVNIQPVDFLATDKLCSHVPEI